VRHIAYKYHTGALNGHPREHAQHPRTIHGTYSTAAAPARPHLTSLFGAWVGDGGAAVAPPPPAGGWGGVFGRHRGCWGGHGAAPAPRRRWGRFFPSARPVGGPLPPPPPLRAAGAGFSAAAAGAGGATAPPPARQLRAVTYPSSHFHDLAGSLSSLTDDVIDESATASWATTGPIRSRIHGICEIARGACTVLINIASCWLLLDPEYSTVNRCLQIELVSGPVQFGVQ